MSKVEDWFVTPLEAHFEAQPTEGGRITILDDMDAYGTDELAAAVEWLKRNRQSVKTFPSPKECLRAIRAVAGNAKAIAASTHGQRITAENYADCAIAFVAGRDPFLIEIDTPQWDEWIGYLEWLGVRWMLDIITLQKREKWTVPAKWPHEFDRRFAATRAA